MLKLSLEHLRELGLTFPSQDKFKQIKASISLSWLIRDAGLSKRQREAIEKRLQGKHKKIDWNYYHGVQKLKAWVKKIS